MDKSKIINIAKISLIPFLIYMKLGFIQLENSNLKILNVISNYFLIISLVVLTIIILNGKKLEKINNKFNKQIKAILIFLSYFVYQEIISTIILIILKLFNITNLNNISNQILSILITTIYLIFIIYQYRKELFNQLKQIKRNYRTYLEVGIPSYMLGLFLMILSNFLFQFVFKMKGPENENEINNLLKEMPIYVAFAASIGAPIIEEMIFRKTLKKIINNSTLYVILSGLIFGLLHVIGSFTGVADLLYVIPYGALGFVFAYMYYKTKNIFVPMSFHLIHNTTLIILQFMVMK